MLCWNKVLKKVKLPLSRATIEKLSTADPRNIFQFLSSLKFVIEELEREKKIEFEKTQISPLYIIANDDMIQVSGNTCIFHMTIYLSIIYYHGTYYFNWINFVSETDFCTKEYLNEEVVQLICKLKHKVKDMEQKVY
jgi:hypothetical protein|uniref:Uncharacterized protein n=1 Tax=Sipha flava TaxID=143950 RepID=A0A2S2QVP2_9HEMI